MITKVLQLFAGRTHKKFVRACKPVVAQINAIEEEYQSLSDEQLKAKTQEFKRRHSEGESLESLLPEAFAVAKNASRRLVGSSFDVCGQEMEWNMVYHDVQMMGGMALHQGQIVEMATGEGKTYLATLPLYLNAITGRNCQLVTANDYLALRDSEWMGYLFNYLGLSIGCIQQGMDSDERREAYGKDITYGTASEFGFDYLRDNGMAIRVEDQVQREHFYCIVDEIDSILIDEARTPLIISGPVQEEREAPFKEFKGPVVQLAQLQQKFCNQLITEAKKELDGAEKPSETTLEKLLLTRLGAPKNKQFMRLMEEGPVRKAFEKFEGEMHSDLRKGELYKLKEQLYFVIEEKQQQADLTEKGRNTIRPDDPDAFTLPDLPTAFSQLDKDDSLSEEDRRSKKQEAEALFAQRSESIHCISQLLRAYCLYERDISYVVQDNKIVIIDQNTGRAMPGRRWSEGLHQAIEAKENVDIQRETKTYATITIQNYFRMYEKLAGMTGTAETEQQEFFDIYKLPVVCIPTHKPCVRKDLNDIIYKTRREKYNAAVEEVVKAHERGQPVLLGTTSVDASEVLSRMLKRAKVPHNVLNAKYHAQEAEIVADAGRKGAVTIATNMAGRGTDIKLGEGVEELGGLYVIGTERHESRRIDLQLRGRCARQGDPGTSRFFVSLEDDLMRLFANAGFISKVLEKSFSEGDALEHPLLNRSIGSAQKKVEQRNYSMRKHLLQYDDVLNKQREVIYSLRNDALHSEDPKPILFELVDEALEGRVDKLEENGRDAEELANLLRWATATFPIQAKEEEFTGKSADEIREELLKRIEASYNDKESVEDPEQLQSLERHTILRAIDRQWQDHLTEMDDLRRSVGLRGYGQKDPLSEYKSEAYAYFESLLEHIREKACVSLFRSSTSVEAFRSMMEKISSKARATGPNDVPAARPVAAEPSASEKLAALGAGVGAPARRPGRPKAQGPRTQKTKRKKR